MMSPVTVSLGVTSFTCSVAVVGDVSGIIDLIFCLRINENSPRVR